RNLNLQHLSIPMIEKRTVIDQIEITRSGHIAIRFGLLLVDDGQEIDCKWHRTMIPPGGDVDAQIALVSEHLAAMGKAPIDSDGIADLKEVAAVVNRLERVRAYLAAKPES